MSFTFTAVMLVGAALNWLIYTYVMVPYQLGFLKIVIFIGVVAAFVGMLAEVFSSDIVDDNLAVPLSVGATMWLLYLLFLPGLNIYQLD